MCDCIERIKKSTEEQFRKTIQANEKFDRVCFDDSAFMSGEIVDNKQTMRLETVSHVSVEHKKTAKNGNVSSKTKVFNFAHKFCPFCGGKYGL